MLQISSSVAEVASDELTSNGQVYYSGIILISICTFCSPDLLFMTSAPQNALLKHYKTSGTRRYSTCKAGNFTKLGTLPDARSHAFSELAQIAPFFHPDQAWTT
jgi:hypothetical protein